MSRRQIELILRRRKNSAFVFFDEKIDKIVLTKKGRIGYITSYENLLLNFIIKPAEADFQLNRFLRRCFLHKTQVYDDDERTGDPLRSTRSRFRLQKKELQDVKVSPEGFFKVS